LKTKVWTLRFLVSSFAMVGFAQNFNLKEDYLEKQFELRRNWAAILENKIQSAKDPLYDKPVNASPTDYLELYFKVESKELIEIRNISFIKNNAVLKTVVDSKEMHLEDRIRWSSVALPISRNELKDIYVRIEFSYQSGFNPFKSAPRIEVVESPLMVPASLIEEFNPEISRIQSVFEVVKAYGFSDIFEMSAVVFLSSRRGQ
jgi:hypothetical protein